MNGANLDAGHLDVKIRANDAFFVVLQCSSFPPKKVKLLFLLEKVGGKLV